MNNKQNTVANFFSSGLSNSNQFCSSCIILVHVFYSQITGRGIVPSDFITYQMNDLIVTNLFIAPDGLAPLTEYSASLALSANVPVSGNAENVEHGPPITTTILTVSRGMCVKGWGVINYSGSGICNRGGRKAPCIYELSKFLPPGGKVVHQQRMCDV